MGGICFLRFEMAIHMRVILFFEVTILFIFTTRIV